jgi:peptide chain release factor 1
MHIPDSKLAQVVDRFDQIQARMSATSDSDEIVQLGKDYAELRPVAEGVRKLQAIREEMSELSAMLDDPEMGAMAKEELQILKENLPEIEHEVALLPPCKAGRSKLKTNPRQIWAAIRKLSPPSLARVFSGK